ncbi:LamG domain-containing protein [Pseudoalteromonas sp. G4]|uniref:LamG domain-containing protein n=1 Tax=Pseudoalteromonas sp. G4 TaxID=2992761 RepID=UPI00237E415E|nr:LamG domain-containing protein [Pseudoalteromonas sp. G4]MDE3273216.1 LamG domain-containing protein [Pseudoalteromonas sp. G4]
MLKQKLLISYFCLIALLPSLAWANLPACEDVFPSALGAFNNSYVTLEKNTEITGQQDNLIYTNNLSTDSSARCNNQTCLKANIEPTQTLAPDITGWKTTIGHAEKLSGDYYINGSVTLYGNNFPLAGPTRIYVTGSVAVNGGSTDHSASDLIIYAEGALTLTKHINLYGYANGAITVDKNVNIQGSLVGGYGVDFLRGSEISYVSPTASTLNIICNAGNTPVDASPIAEFRFDEFSWLSGVNNQVIESINGTHATPYNLQPSEGKICNAANFDDALTNARIDLDENLISGREFTISAWLKSSFTGSQVLVSGAQNNNNANELIWWHPSSQLFEPWIKQDRASRISIRRHFVWRRNGDTSCFYVNGQQAGCVSDHSNGSLNIARLMLGQEQDSLGGGFDVNQRFRGLVDELLIFDKAISDTQIQTIYENQNQGLGWDGADRDNYCGANGWWQLDNDFLDANLTDPHHLLPSGNPTFGITSPGPANTIGNQSTCNYAQFDGTNYASVDDSGDFNYQELTVSTWVYPTENRSGLRSLVSKDEHFEFHLDQNNRLFWWWQNAARQARSFTSSRAIPLNQWTHVAVVYKSGSQRMYINGIADASRTYTDGLADSPCKFFIGVDVGTNTSSQCGGVRSDRYFKGHLDEVRIYSRALLQSEIQTDMNTVRTCDNLPSVDHYRLTLNDNTGLTCEAETMTIEVCADDTCSSYYPNTATVALATSGGGSLSWLPSNPFTVNGSLNVNLNNTQASTVFYSLNNAASNPSSNLRCFVGGSEVTLANCYTEFADTGFKLSTIEDQISGIPYAAELMAVKKSDDTGACENVFSGSQVVNFTNNFLRPNTPSAMTFSVNSSPVTTNTPITVNFDPANNYKANLALNYLDAGEISLSVSATAPNGANLIDTSNAYVVRPQRFNIVVADNPNAIDAESTVFKMASEDFSFSVEAHNANGDVTTNFNSTEITGTVSLSHNLQAPLTGIEGLLSPNAVPTNGFVSGVATLTDAKFNEVGIIELLANLSSSDYLNHSDGGLISGSKTNVGRFIPAQFTMVNPLVISGCGGFTYYGQPFERFSYEVHAQDILGNVLANYLYSATAANNFAKATIDNLIENDDPDAAKYKSASELAARYSLTASAINWDKGKFIVNSGDVVLNRDEASLSAGGLPSSPMEQLLPLVRLTDPDGKALNDLDQDANLAGGITTIFDSKRISGPFEMRFGRYVVSDNYGSEFEHLQIPMKVEYWDGNNFILNRDDNCSSYFESRLVIEDNHDTVNGHDGSFNKGTYATGNVGIQLKAPNLPRTFTVDYSSPETWLRFDWNGDNNYNDANDNPSGVLQFGRFRGNDRVIYWREN